MESITEMKNNFEALDSLTTYGAFLTTTNNEGITNMMTVSWGFVGFAWRKPYFIVMIRPQRYTLEVLKNAVDYTVSVPLKGELREALGICGSKSGKVIDKEKEAKIKFTDGKGVNSKIVDNCKYYFECKLMYVDQLKAENLSPDIKKDFYPGDDEHFMCYGEIVEYYEK